MGFSFYIEGRGGEERGGEERVGWGEGRCVMGGRGMGL